MLEGIKEKFSRFVARHVINPGDGPDVITREDLYSPEVLSLSESAMVHPAVVKRHRDFCEEMGIEIISRKQALQSLRSFISINRPRTP